MRKKITAFILAIMMVVTLPPITALAGDYENHWAGPYIEKVHERDWMVGDGNGNFRPDDSITRGEFSLMLWRALGSPVPQGDCLFTDIAADAYYREAVTALYEADVVTGYGGGLFGPNDSLTREMAFIMLAHAFDLAPSDPIQAAEYTAFDDFADVSSWATDATSILVLKGYVEGAGGKLLPKKALTRGEMAKLLVTVYDGENPSDGQPVVDTAPIITLSQSPTASTFNNVKINVSVETKNGISFIGWRSSSDGAKYTDKTSFTDITSSKEFSVSSNGWYAVCAVDALDNFSFKLIQITNSRKRTPTVTSVTVTPSSINIEKGGTQQFYATVQGTNNPAQTITWTVEGGTNETAVSNSGLLTVAVAETAELLTVRATSMANNTKFGTATVTVNDYCVTYNANGGANPPAPQYGDFPGIILVATQGSMTAPSGYINDDFAGWNTEANGSGTGYAANANLTADVGNTTLYAMWLGANIYYPIPITSADGLDNIRNGLGKHYRLDNDIDLDGWNIDSDNWTPIGYGSYPFTGSLDGKNNKISNMKITKTVGSTISSAGLFGYTQSGVVKDLRLIDMSIDVTEMVNASNLWVGGVAGINEGGTISGCSVSGQIWARSSQYDAGAGGVVGKNEAAFGPASITNCYVSNCDVSAIGGSSNISARAYAGGVAGYNWGRDYMASVANCYAKDVNVLAQGGPGNSYTAGNEAYAGGVVGYNSAKSNELHGMAGVTYCYAKGGFIFANSGTIAYAGGVAGYNDANNSKAAYISDCAALTDKVRAISSGPKAARRVLGQIDTSAGTATLTNNRANSAMTLNSTGDYAFFDQPVNDSPSNPQNTLNGKGATPAQYSDADWWCDGLGSGFWDSVWYDIAASDHSSAPWQWDSTAQLPRLYWQ